MLLLKITLWNVWTWINIIFIVLFVIGLLHGLSNCGKCSDDYVDGSSYFDDVDGSSD